MRSASSLRRHCAYPEVLARIKPRSERQQAAMDLGTTFHKAVEAWARTGDIWAGVQASGSDEVRGWLELMATHWSPIPGALHEHAIGLSTGGEFVEVMETSPHVYVPAPGAADVPLLTAGRADVMFMRDDGFLGHVAVVQDFKTGRYPVDPPAINLQLAALGFAAAGYYGAEALQVAIYYARDGVFEWGDVVPLDSPEAAALWADVERAALLDDRPRPGPHCEPCWERRLARCKFADLVAKEEAR